MSFGQAKAEGLKATCETLLSKLENLKAQFMYKTYTAQNLQALYTVAGHIDGRHQELQNRVAKVGHPGRVPGFSLLECLMTMILCYTGC